ncbi:MAG: hypothetical protein WCK02_15095 [Bacteroidota bacterium]
MKINKKIGIWMDHSTANVMELKDGVIETQNIVSHFNFDDKQEALQRSEKIMHNKEQHQQTEFYKKLIKTIKKYDEVILFGPTDAKVELFNVIKSDPRLETKIIGIQKTDVMTENQQQAFVKKHFDK